MKFEFKKVITILFALVLLLTFVACGGESKSPEKEDTKVETSEEVSKEEIKDEVKNKPETSKEEKTDTENDNRVTYQADGYTILIDPTMTFDEETQEQMGIPITMYSWQEGDEMFAFGGANIPADNAADIEFTKADAEDMFRQIEASYSQISDVTADKIEEISIASKDGYSQKLTLDIGEEKIVINSKVAKIDNYLFVGTMISAQDNYDEVNTKLQDILDSIQID